MIINKFFSVIGSFSANIMDKLGIFKFLEGQNCEQPEINKTYSMIFKGPLKIINDLPKAQRNAIIQAMDYKKYKPKHFGKHDVEKNKESRHGEERTLW